MKIFITGGLGFVGRHVSRAFLQAGHQVTAVGRSRQPEMIDHPNFDYLAADTTQPGDWQRAVGEHQAVVNLAGRSIFTLWTERAKKEMVDSRVLTTRHLVEAIGPGGPTLLCSTSAVGYYGDRGEDHLTEAAAPGDDFLAALSLEWEAEALKAEARGVRVVLTRFGIVLERGGGAMAMMIPAFRLYLAGPLGSGQQWFPWIHMQDLTAAFQFVVDHEKLSGAFNFCAPEPVRNQRLTRTLADQLDRPAFLWAPSLMVKMVLGEFGQVLLHSQRVTPARLTEAGFTFQYPTIDTALTQIVAQ